MFKTASSINGHKKWVEHNKVKSSSETTTIIEEIDADGVICQIEERRSQASYEDHKDIDNKEYCMNIHVGNARGMSSVFAVDLNSMAQIDAMISMLQRAKVYIGEFKYEDQHYDVNVRVTDGCVLIPVLGGEPQTRTWNTKGKEFKISFIGQTGWDKEDLHTGEITGFIPKEDLPQNYAQNEKIINKWWRTSGTNDEWQLYEVVGSEEDGIELDDELVD